MAPGFEGFWPDARKWSLNQALAWAVKWAPPGAIDPVDRFYMATLGADDLAMMRSYLYPLQYLSEARFWVSAQAQANGGQLPEPTTRLTIWQLASAIEHLERSLDVASVQVDLAGPVGKVRKSTNHTTRLTSQLAAYHAAVPEVLRLQLYVPHFMQGTYYGKSPISTPASAGIARLGL